MKILQKEEELFTLKNLDMGLEDLKNYIKSCSKSSVEAHKVEKKIFSEILKLGYKAFGWYLCSQGDGDIGAEVKVEKKKLKRSKEKHTKIHRSVFGRYEIKRYVYAKREKQKIELMPLDARLNLPEREYSYMLCDISQMLTTEIPFGQVQKMLEKILGTKISVDTLERTNRDMSETVSEYRKNQAAPKKEEEGKILVQTADCKGVPIRHERDKARIYDHEMKMGPKPDRKKMAVIGGVYSVDPFKRTPQEVIQALFNKFDKHEKKRVRPKPKNKRIFPCLTQENENEEKATDIVFTWMSKEAKARRFGTRKQHLLIMDGQISLWNAGNKYFPSSCIEILDLLHVTSKLWDATSVFGYTKQSEKIDFLYKRVWLILQGKVSSVITGFRRMATLRKLPKKQHEKIEKICSYFSKNHHRMQYDVYLSKGFPIATGIIEGACLHYIKDRMERTGARWIIPGAQAMLETRATYLNGYWDQFQSYWIQQKTKKLYPYRHTLISQTA